MMTTPPTATEETGHTWIDVEGGQVNLTAAVAATIRDDLLRQDGVVDHGPIDDNLCVPWLDQEDVDFGAIANAVLSIPVIAEALELYSRTVVVTDEPARSGK